MSSQSSLYSKFGMSPPTPGSSVVSFDPLASVTAGLNAVSTVAAGIFGAQQGQRQAELAREQLRQQTLQEREARIMLLQRQDFAAQQAAFEASRELRNQQILGLLAVGLVGVTVAGGIFYVATKRR